MSNLFSSKPLSKPLKGGAVTSNYGSFNTINAGSLKLESLNIAGVFEDGIFLNVIIQDSELKNTVIGLEGPNVGHFTQIQTRSDVTMLSNIPGSSVTWDPDTGIFYISSELKVGGCSQLGNIEICGNDITSTNINGDINISPDGLGTVKVNAPVYIASTNGSYYTELPNGSVKFLVDKEITLYSSHGSAVISTFADQTLSTKNGDLTLNVETGRTTGSVSNVNFTNGNIVVTSIFNHNLTTGNTVTISNSLLNGTYTVGSIISDTSFRLTTTSATTSIASGGTFLKTIDNNIVLNSQNLVKIPTSTRLTFGDTTNSVSGNTAGLTIKSLSDVAFDVLPSNKISIPQTTQIQLGTAGNNYINFDGSSLNIAGSNRLTATGSTFQINTTNTRFYDPILTIGDYNLTSDDLKDRGVEFRYYDTTAGSMKLGWFGFKTTTNLFTFIPDATNNNEIISGLPGNFELNNLQVSVVNLNAGGTFNANCGRLVNVNLITGCSNNITIAGSSNITLNASNRISLASSTDILVPNNVPMKFGTSGSYITESTMTTLRIASATNTRFLTQSRGTIMVPIDTALSFDGTSTGSLTITGNTSGELTIKSNQNIYITTTGGNVILPANTRVHYGSSSQTMFGSSAGMRIISGSTTSTIDLISNSNVNISSSLGDISVLATTGDINLYPTNGNVRIPSGRRLILGVSGTSNSIVLATSGNIVVSGNTSNSVQLTDVSNVDLFASGSVNIPTNTRLRIGSDGLKSLYSDTSNTTSFENTTSNGSIIISSANSSIINTGGTTRFINQNMWVTSGSFVVIGTVGSIARIDTENFKVTDPIVSIADYTTTLPDGKDRGIEYNYRRTTAGSMRLGWFGVKDTNSRFTYYSDAVNTNEVISGTIGDLEVSTAYLRNGLSFLNSGSLDMNCGTLFNVNTINGCSGVVNINGTNTITHNASNIILNAGTQVQLPFNVPLNFGSTSNSISCTSSGNINIRGGTVVFDANIQINGTTTAVYSTVTNIQDPIFSLGGVTGPLIDDNKDRGIEFKWNDSSVSKVGYFGFKDSTQRFVYIRDGTNTNEVFSGVYGDVEFGNGYFTGLNFTTGVGSITGVNEISGGSITLKTTSGNVNILPTQGSNVIIPFNSTLAFGTTSNGILSDTSGNMTYTSSNNTTILSSSGSINLSTSNAIRAPANVPLYFGQTNATYLLSTGGNLVLFNSQGNIDLTPQSTFGSVNIPVDNKLQFGNANNSIYSDGNELFINGYNGINFATSTVNFSGNVNIIGSISATGTTFDFNDYILPLGKYQVMFISNIQNSVTTGGNIQITSSLVHNLVLGDVVTLRNTDSEPGIDGTYTITAVTSATTFKIQRTDTIFNVNGSTGTIKSNLTTQQGKDVGIQVNYWSTTGNAGLTAGTLGFKTGFFGFDQSSERWSFWSDATISNSVVSGSVGDIEVNKVFANRLSGFALDGAVSGGTNSISGTNFTIGGGTINNTPIGTNTAQSGRFTNLSNTVTASFSNVTLQGSLGYAVEKYTLSSISPTRSPSMISLVSMFSVSGVNYTGSSGTMPSTSIAEGTYKILVCQAMGLGCTHTIFFGANKLIAPNPMNASSVPTKLVFKRRGQSAQLIFDGSSWVLIGAGAYIQE